MTLPNLFRKSLFAALFACALLQFAPAGAQSTQPGLESIGRQMFREGNERFILVEAMKDGFITEGHKYDLQHVNGVVKINGKPLREPFQKHYNSLIKKFAMMESARKGTEYKMEAMHGDGLKLKDVMNPESDFRSMPVSGKQG